MDHDECGGIAYAELKISEHKTKHPSAFRDCYMHAYAPGGFQCGCKSVIRWEFPLSMDMPPCLLPCKGAR